MAEPKLWIDPIDVFVGRSLKITGDLYSESNEPKAIAAGDVVKAFVWQDDGTAPTMEAASDGVSPQVTVTEAGADGVTPARIEVLFTADDTDALTAEEVYAIEILVTDASDGDRPIVVARGELHAYGSSTGTI